MSYVSNGQSKTQDVIVDINGKVISKTKTRKTKSITSEQNVATGTKSGDFAQQARTLLRAGWILNGLGLKKIESAKRTLSVIETVHMLRKNQMVRPGIAMFKLCCKLAG